MDSGFGNKPYAEVSSTDAPTPTTASVREWPWETARRPARSSVASGFQPARTPPMKGACPVEAGEQQGG